MEAAITDYQSFLETAKEEVSALEDMTGRQSAMEAQLKQTREQLEREEKAVAERTASAIRKRSADISASYDKELEKCTDSLKRVKAAREKARNQGILDRIGEETAGLREENRQLDLQMKTMFHQDHVPAFCRSSWYYTLYYPGRISEFFKFVLTVLVCFLVIPYGLYLLIPGRKPLILVGIYFASILLFGGLYVLIGNRTKDAHADTLREGRRIRDQILANEKKIRAVTRTIRKDKNEAAYDLQSFDDELARITQLMKETGDKKQEALNTFEKVTRQIITDEIREAAREKLELLRETETFQSTEYKNLTEAISKANLHITDTYGPYLEQEFLHTDRLDALAKIMDQGTAVNLSEAMETFRKQKS